MAMSKHEVVNGALMLPAGTILKLNKEQAAIRAPRLKPLGKNVFTATDEIQFKQGEVIEIDLEALPKVLRQPVIPTVPDAGTVDTAASAPAPQVPVDGDASTDGDAPLAPLSV